MSDQAGDQVLMRHLLKPHLKTSMRFRFQYLVLIVFVVTTLAAWYSISTMSEVTDRSDSSDLEKEANWKNKPNDLKVRLQPENGQDMKESLSIQEGGNEEIKRISENFRSKHRQPEAANGIVGLNDQLKRMELRQANDPDKNSMEDDIGVPLQNEIPTFNLNRIKSQSKELTRDDVRHDRWIVLTTVSPPTSDVIYMANLTGWQVVVVGDTKTPRDWSHPNCVYLSIARQESMGLSITSRLPYKSYARKNVGYLYAIAHGAKVVYETDDDNRPLDNLRSFELEPTTSGLMFAGTDLFNPYHHFGQPTLWPRGYPLSKVGADSTSTYRLYDQWVTPYIQQGLVNGDPDMDAIFRLTRKLTHKPLHVHFDLAAPPALLPAGVFSPFNSQNTLFLKEAFWGLLIPTTTTFRICDIWRGYWVQRLIWEIDGNLGFFPPNAYQQRNAHDYMADMEEEKDMYFNTERLLSFLKQWKCNEDLTFFQCVYKLSADMAQEKFWKWGDVELTKLWLEDLINIGYKEPRRKNVAWKYDLIFKSDKENRPLVKAAPVKVEDSHRANSPENMLPFLESDLEKRRYLTLRHGSDASFSAATQQAPDIVDDKHQHTSWASRHAESIARLCPGLPVVSTPTQSINKAPGRPFDDVLLVIIFNWPFYGNVRSTEIMFRPIFRNIVYCGTNHTLFTRDTAFLGKNLSFIDEPGIGGGHFSQVCALRVMQMNLKVKGYLITGDDVLLNTWNFARFDKNKVWMIGERFVFNVTARTWWMWWPTNMGSPAYHSAMTRLNKLSASNQGLSNNERRDFSKRRNATNFEDQFPSPPGVLQPKHFLARLNRNTGNASFGVHAISDVYYIPERLRPSAVAYLNHFTSHHLFQELAVPLTLYGLDDVTNFESFNGVNLWMEERSNPWSRFTLDNHFLHPVKLSVTENLLPLCTTYLPALLARGHSAKSNSSR